MKTRVWLSLVLWVVALAAGWLSYQQSRSLRSMRMQISGTEQDTGSHGPGTLLPSGESMAIIPEPAPTSVERVELMRLRSRVTELRERLREREKVSNQLRQLQTQVEAVGRYANGRFPAGFRRRQDARAVGGATPEAALETFYYSLEHQDTNLFLQSLEPKDRERMEAQLASVGGGGASLFEAANVLPGFLVVGRTNLAPDLVELQVEVGSGGAVPMKLRLVDDAWRIGF